MLVLDDYHVLTDRRIHEAVEFLVSYLPPSLRLVDRRPRGPAVAARPAAGPRRADRAAGRGPAVLPGRGGRAAVDGVGRRPGPRRDGGRVGTDRGLGGGPAAGRSGAAGERRAERRRPGARRRPAPARLLRRRGAARPGAAATRPARAGRAAGAALGPAVRRRAAGGRARPRCWPSWSRPTSSWPPWTASSEWYRCHRLLRDALLRAVPRRRPDAARSSAAPRPGSPRRTGSTTRSGTCCGRATTTPPRRCCTATRRRGSSHAGRRRPTCSSASSCRDRRCGPHAGAARWPTRRRCAAAGPGAALARTCDVRASPPTPSSPGWHSARAAVLCLRRPSAPRTPRPARAVALGAAGRRRWRPRAGRRASDRPARRWAARWPATAASTRRAALLPSSGGTRRTRHWPTVGRRCRSPAP